MKRLLAAATSIATLVTVTLGSGLVTSPAGAVDPSTPVYDGLPDGWSFDWLGHASPEYGSFGNYQHVTGAPAGWGTGSLLLQMGPVSEANLKVTRSLAGLSAASAWVRVSDIPALPESFGFFVNVQGTTYSAPLPISLSWTEVDLGNLPLTEYGNPSNEATLLGLAASHPTTATLIFNANNGFDAGGAQAFVDGVSFTADGATEAVDFEDPHTPTTCVLTRKRQVIEAGEMAQLTGRILDDQGAGVARARFDLLVRDWGQPTSRVLMRPFTNSHGSIGMAKLQMRRTEYQMSLPQTVTLGRCRSALVVVAVRTKLTISAPAAASAGHRIEATGRTTPAKPGTPVTLWRVRPGADIKLATGTLTKKGAYGLAAKAASTGVWKVYVKVAAATGNLAGTSPTVSVRVT